MIVSLTAAIVATSISLNYAFFFTRIFVCTNLAWTTESVFLDIRTRSSFANASLVTRENSAKQVIMWPANADIFCLCLRHKEYFSGRNIVEIRQRLRLSYTESSACNLEPYHGPTASRSFEVVGKTKVCPTRKWRTSERCLERGGGGSPQQGFILESSALRSTWDQVLFSFRFENNIPAGKAKRKAVAVRENVWEPLKLGLISGYLEVQLLTLLYNIFWEKSCPSPYPVPSIDK